ncbi:MAG: hypothetical protein IRY83_03655 [Chloroflexi bacterium]|jgi:rhodanese-related sulfurtransferase|nr:hypothetical protein [Chloroflexota bacterium]
MAVAPRPRPEAPRITAAEARALLARNQAVAVDVRTPEEYAVGHLPGALLIPLRRLAAQLGELPRDKTIIFY